MLIIKTFKMVEPNLLKGLQPGFVLAQDKYADCAEAVTVEGEKYIPNGVIAALGTDGALGAVVAGSKELFIHYTDPLVTAYGGENTFAVHVDDVPRMVQLIPGDEWTTDWAYDLGEGKPLVGRIVVVDADATLPNGDAATRYRFIG